MKKTTTTPTPAVDNSILSEPRVTPKEAARLLNRCTKSVLTLIKKKKIKPVFRNATSGPGAIEIPLSSIRTYQQKLLKGGVR